MIMHKRLRGLLLCILMLLSCALPAYAEDADLSEEPAVTELRIVTADDFLAFAENCRLDSYSQNLAVTLEANIDLTGISFSSIPTFSGLFDGKGHTISGLSLTSDGSVQGLFRYLTATATVQNLNIRGEIHPGGSRNQIGAVAGENAGYISGCSFTGSISGGDYIGGLVGVNTVTGIIDNCHMSGDIHGDHFVGGIAGENSGVIRNCTNNALVNTTPQQNSIDISDITLDTLTNTETVNTVTDIGGIAGISSGVILGCENQGNVGYQHMGYNVGGIAGTQSGYILECTNHGSIQGRKEVGGIVGQMEPTSMISYSEDTLQILRGQLGTLSGLVSQASGNAQTNANQISSQIGILQDQAQTARDAVDALFPDAENPELPDPDAIIAAQNTLTTTLNAMPGTLRSISAATQNTITGLTRDLNAISSQVSIMGNTINGASENLGGSITDISDLDTADMLSGKLEGCVNEGNILADLNVGGIAGAMAMETDLDILEDWDIYGEESLNFASEIRAVILQCENRGTVTGIKQNVGGIAGWQSVGLVKNCVNTGKIDAESADYAGGISGLSTGYIRNSHVKCVITASTYAGGIAGSATVATDCISMVQIENVREYLGAILGDTIERNTQSDTLPISGNLYPVIFRDIGAIDGISYKGIAEPMELNTFLMIENLPEVFNTVTVRFLFEDGTQNQIAIRPGGSVQANQIPMLPEKEGFTAKWSGLDQADLSNVIFDMCFEAVYTPYRTTVQSQQSRENGLPILLIEGAFADESVITAEASQSAPPLTEQGILVESWTIHASEGSAIAHFLLPDGVNPAKLQLLICGDDGTWKNVAFTQDKSYLVFPISAGTVQLALLQKQASGSVWLLAGMGVLAAGFVSLYVFRGYRRSKSGKSNTRTSK